MATCSNDAKQSFKRNRTTDQPLPPPPHLSLFLVRLVMAAGRMVTEQLKRDTFPL